MARTIEIYSTQAEARRAAAEDADAPQLPTVLPHLLPLTRVYLAAVGSALLAAIAHRLPR